MKYAIIAYIEAPDDVSALQVASERLGHDEDYGFPYTIDNFTVKGTPEGAMQTKLSGKLILSMPGGYTVFALSPAEEAIARNMDEDHFSSAEA